MLSCEFSYRAGAQSQGSACRESTEPPSVTRPDLGLHGALEISMACHTYRNSIFFRRTLTLLCVSVTSDSSVTC